MFKNSLSQQVALGLLGDTTETDLKNVMWSVMKNVVQYSAVQYFEVYGSKLFPYNENVFLCLLSQHRNINNIAAKDRNVCTVQKKQKRY